MKTNKYEHFFKFIIIYRFVQITMRHGVLTVKFTECDVTVKKSQKNAKIQNLVTCI